MTIKQNHQNINEMRSKAMDSFNETYLSRRKDQVHEDGAFTEISASVYGPALCCFILLSDEDAEILPTRTSRAIFLS